MKRSGNAGQRRRSATTQSKSLPTSTPSVTPAEDIQPQHQLDRVQRCLKNLQESKKAQESECSKLSKMKPTDTGFDVQAATLAEATRKLISARKSYLECARTI